MVLLTTSSILRCHCCCHWDLYMPDCCFGRCKKQSCHTLLTANLAGFSSVALFCVEWLAGILKRTFPTTAMSEFDITFIDVTANTICMGLTVGELAARSGMLATICLFHSWGASSSAQYQSLSASVFACRKLCDGQSTR